MHQLLLEKPVEYGDLRLAPTTELAGLAEFASAGNDIARLDAIVRVAAAIREEDAERRHLSDMRARAARNDLPSLPKRR